VRHVAFAPFLELFPHCAAVVHHGGIGTVAKCFASGVPQLVLPIAFDQKDNAIRVKRLGAGDWVRAGRATGPRVAELLKGLLTTEVKRRAEEIARRFAGEDALEAAADAVEDLAASPPLSPVLGGEGRGEGRL
jgi:UDP:flavonoid glycosyltransferase YjiC (YdhE family)